MDRPYYTDGVSNEGEARQHYQGRELKLYGQNVKFEGNSSYRSEYPQHPLEARPQVAAPQYTGSGNKFEGNSTYSSEYQPHAFPERPAQAPRAPYNSLPFDGSSTYGSAYVQHPYERQQPYKATAQEVNTGKFDGTTSYSRDYLATQLPPGSRHAAPAAAPYNSLPFEATTTYKDQYVQHPFDATRMPANYALAQPLNNAPFEGTSSYQDTYKQHPLQQRPGPRPQQPLNSLPFDGTSSYNDNYKAWPMDPNAGRVQHQQPPMKASAPFDGTTTNRDFFKGWQLPAKRPPLGVEMWGDRAYILIPADARVPATGKQLFTTVHDNQSDMCILILAATSAVASQCPVVGQFDLQGIPPGPAGAAKIEVSIYLDANNVLQVTAVDIDANRQQQWLHQGKMTAWSRSEMVREAR